MSIIWKNLAYKKIFLMMESDNKSKATYIEISRVYINRLRRC